MRTGTTDGSLFGLTWVIGNADIEQLSGRNRHMTEEVIAEIGIDGQGRLFVRPSTRSFDYIYRAAMEVHWDEEKRQLFAPKRTEWTYPRWFQQILAAAADEYGVRLNLNPSTIWSNVPETCRVEMENLATAS